MARYMTVVASILDADSPDEALSMATRAFSHTPLGNGSLTGFEIERLEGEIPSKMLMAVGKWLAEVYPVVVAAYKQDHDALNSWGRFLCDMEEGAGGA